MVKQLLPIILLMATLPACAGTEIAATVMPDVIVVAETPTPNKTPVAPSSIHTHKVSPTSSSMPTYMPIATATITPTPSATSAVWVESGTPVAVSEAIINSENVTKLTELARWGRGVISDIDLSADGQWLAVAAGSGVYIHNINDLYGKPRAIEVDGNVTAVAIAPDGEKVAIVLRNNTLEVWLIDPINRLFTNEGFFNRVQFSHDGSILAAGKISQNGSDVELWSSDEGKLLVSYPVRHFPGFKFSPSTPHIAVWSDSDHDVTVYDWQNNQIAFTGEASIHPPDDELSYQALLHDAVFVREDSLQLLVHEGREYTFTTGRVEVQEVRQDIENDLLFSLDSIGLLSGATKYVCNEPVVYWSAPEPAVPHQIESSNNEQIIGLRYKSPSFSGDYREYSSVRFYRISDGRLLYAVEEGIVDFVLLPDGERWLAGLQDGRLQIRQLSDGAVLESVDAYESPLLDLTVSVDDQWVGAIYLDEVKVYQREDGRLVYRYPANSLSFAPDANSFALGYEDGRIEIRDISDGSLLSEVVAHEERITTVYYTPSGDLLSAGFDCQLTRWQTPDLAPLGLLENVMVEGHFSGEQVPMRVQKFLAMPDSQAVIGLFYGGEFTVWSLPGGAILRTPKWDSPVSILAVSADNRYLAVPRYYTVDLWDETLTTLEVWASSANFSPSTDLLIGGQSGHMQDRSLEGAIQLWQIPNMTLLYVATPQTAEVTAVNFTHNGQLIVTAALDGVIRLWGIP
jgi:WD40 repeat protein